MTSRKNAERGTSVARHVGPRPKPRPAAPAERCGQPRTDGSPCRRAAGWATDTPGEGPCREHGGSTVQREAAKERLADQALTVARLIVKARTTPLTLREQVEGATAARDVLAASKRRRSRPAGG